MVPDAPFLDSASSLENLVRQWLKCSLPGPEFTHAAHLAVCAWLSFDFQGEALVQKMKRHLIRFNKKVGTPNTEDRGYHETLTRFWCARVEEAVAGSVIRLGAARAAVGMYGDDRLAFDRYYSFDVLKSREARKCWIEPDVPQPKAGSRHRD
jgi:hypothetical protein